jgi:hypothetical protein
MLKTYKFDKQLLGKIQKTYKRFNIDQLQIKDEYLDENKPEKLLEKVYIHLNEIERYSFAGVFEPDLDYIKSTIYKENYFKEFYSILKEIFSIFSKSKNKFVLEYIKNQTEKKKIIDTQIKLYKDFKFDWYKQLLEIFEDNNIS